MNCISYSRISSINQTKGHSIQTQKEIIQKYADDNNLNIIHYYNDIGSGIRMNLLQNLNYILNNYSNIKILVHNIDRFSRNLKDACIYLEEFQKKNIIIYAIEQDISNDTISSTRLLKTYINDAEFESKMIGLRVKKTLGSIKKQGGHIGGVRYGFKKKRIQNIPVIIKDSDEDAIIKLIIDLRIGVKTSKELSEVIIKITNTNKPLIIYDKHDNEIEKFAKPFSLTFKEIADILNDYKITIRGKNCKGTTINNIFNKNCDKNKIKKIKNQNIGILNTLFSNFGF
jgi:DNA invertase Pin-like site-specific DNA recombinase